MGPLVIVALLLAPVAYDLVRHASFRRLAIRNVLRRPAEAALVVVGGLLGTAIITAAFIVGDTFDASIRDFGRTELGPVDEQVRVTDLELLDDVVASVASEPLPGTDGTLTTTWSGAAVASVGEARNAEPFTTVGELDFDAARAFGGDVGDTGLADAGATPTGTDAVINEMLADELDVAAGDEIEVFAFGQSRTYTVRDVLPRIGLAGYSGVYVEPGTVSALYATSTSRTAEPPSGELLISNDGGVFDGAKSSDAVMQVIQERLAVDPALFDAAQVEPVKQDLLESAEAQGKGIGELFFGIGAFSVLVGVLLLVNLFVMLAEERKSELGMLRAVGLKRNHLLRTFGIEGALYSVVAALAGGVAGIAVGRAIVAIARAIIAADDPDMNFMFSVEPASLVAGITIGLAISLLTVWGTSSRIAQLNVIRAIRDLPEPTTDRLSLGKVVLSGVGVLFGVMLAFAGIGGGGAIPTLAGPPIALLSAIPLLRSFIGRRAATIGLSTLSLAWSVLCFNLVPESMESSDISVFVVQGVVSVASAIGIVSSLDLVWARISDRLISGGGGLATRLALAYPLARKVRTGILLAMFSLVIFTMTFMSVFTGIFGEQAGTFAEQTDAGYDLFVDSNSANPVTEAQLRATDGVRDVAPLLVGYPRYTAPFEAEPTFWSMTGIDERYIEHESPELAKRLPRFADNRAVYDAVLADPTLAVVSDFFLQEGGGPPDARMHVGDTFTAIDPAGGDVRELTVAAITSNDWTFNGVLVNRDLITDLLRPRAVESRHYVSVDDGVDPEVVADRLTGDLIPNGVDARTFLDELEGELAEQQGFFRLMQGYLGLGLTIGIAGLGVVMVRAVRERRRQVGMLRAMGFSAAIVRRAFLLEAVFIAAQGVALGIGLGLLTSYQVLTNSETFGDQRLPFAVPWLALAVLFFVPLLAAMAATVAPAAQAAAIRPAAALRIAD